MPCHEAWLFVCTTLLLFTRIHGFEIFAEQQTLILNDPNHIVNYNNTEYGSTHVDDYWTKLDINYSPLPGWSLSRHVRLGCFMVAFYDAPADSYVERIDSDINEIECVSFCNRTQAYYQYPNCRCGLNESALVMQETAGGICQAQAWEVFREYDYRSSMSPATYDVTRRLVYQIVTMRVPHADPSIQYYIHAVNAMESKPKFEFDIRLERMVFNAVWDFGRSRMVALSFEQWGAPLDFTLVAFNTSTGALMVQQAHYPLSNQITATSSLLSAGFASADGMGTVDILYGTYYTVVPAMLPESPQVVHVIVAIDIDTKRVIHHSTLPVTLMNLQINALQHVLYGAGADLAETYAYYKLCEAANATDPDGEMIVEVACPFEVLSTLPAVVQHVYLQSASIDHHFNYAWMTYKQEATGRPLVLEYHHDDGEAVLWREDSLPLEAAFSSLIQTVPRIIFSLYPPSIASARFSVSGTKIFVSFNGPTLRGAMPIDLNGDEIPDYFDPEDKLTRAPCNLFFDDFTMQLIPDSMCQWTSDSDLFIEINVMATIIPGDLVRVNPSRIFAGKVTLGGVYLFSQPSTDFAVVQVPEFIPYPTVLLGGNLVIDTCTELVLDGSQSKDHGFRGTFVWTLNRTDPATSEPHMRQISEILEEMQLTTLSPQSITFPAGILKGNHRYYITLTVISFWDSDKYSSRTHGVKVSGTAVPPLFIFGPSERTVQATDRISLASQVYLEGCLNASSATTVSYSWIGCLSSQKQDVFEGTPGCPEWDPSIPLDQVSGTQSKSLIMQPQTLGVLNEYLFTVTATVMTPSGPLLNFASATIFVELPELELIFYGSNSFSAAQNLDLVVDVSESVDPADPSDSIGGPAVFNFSCEVSATGEPCFSSASSILDPTTPVFPGLGSGDDLTSSPFRRLATEGTWLPYMPCALTPRVFEFRGNSYSHAEAITEGDLSQLQRYCMQPRGVLVIQKNFLQVGKYIFRVNMTKLYRGVERSVQGTLIVSILEGNTLGLAAPQVIITVESSKPYTVGKALRLVGEVTNTRNTTVYTYSWSVYQYIVNPDYDYDRAIAEENYNVPQFRYVAVDAVTLDLNDPAEVRTPVGSRYFVIQPNVLSPGMQYKMRLDVSDAVLYLGDSPDAIGSAEFMFTAAGLPPSGGYLSASTLEGEAFATVFTLTMERWGSDDIPLTYQFSYVRDFQDQFAEPTYLRAIYNERGFEETVLPPGVVMPSYQLRVIGYAQSSVGAIASSSLELSVTPPTDSASRQEVIRRINDMDPETALLAATMIAQDAIPNSLELGQILNATLNAGILNSTAVPDTPTMVAKTLHFLSELCMKGLRIQQLLDTMEHMQNRSIDAGYVTVETALQEGPENVVRQLIVLNDCLTPGDVPEVRRLSGSWRPRALQATPVMDERSMEELFNDMLRCRAQKHFLGTELLLQLYPRESPANMSVRGQDFYLGKDFTHLEGALQQHSEVRSSFAIPSLDAPGLPEVYTYRYTQWKKYPYIFMPLPEKRTLLVPTESADITARRIPLQGYRVDERLWHAMSLEITDERGGNADEMVNASLQNATFSVLPRIAAHPLHSYATYEHAATCYAVNVGENVTEANYDARGLVYSEDACVTKRLSDFVVLIDDLPRELELMEDSAGDFLGSYLDGYKSMAMVSTIVFAIIVAFLAAACAHYVDESQQGVDAIDQIKTRVIEKPDQKEKLIETLLFTFKRDHLLVGMGQKHRKLTREKRVWAILLAWLATEAIATLMNTKLRFKAERHFVAIGLVAGVLVFPLTQFVQFLYEWRPTPRTFSLPPLGSKPANPIPLKQQAQAPQVAKPKRPSVPQHIVPPPPGAPPRAGPLASLALPVIPPGLPLELPALRQGDGSKKVAPPPRQEQQKPRPPKEPPPAQHLVAARPPGGPPPSGLQRSDLPPMPALRAAGPYGLTLPELPPLPIGTHRVEGGLVPAPPPKRPGAGPKPPQAPPPLTKMFFAVPQNAQLRVPPVPPLKAGPPRGPKLPPLPKLMRPHEVLGAVKLGGDSARHAPPPPPPPKVSLGHFPAPPMTPREDEDDWNEGGATPKAARPALPLPLPSAVMPAELTTEVRASQDQPPPPILSGRPVLRSPKSGPPREDVESTPPPKAMFSQDPEHAMMRPLRPGEVPPPPPLPPQGASPSRLPALPELPGVPTARRRQGRPDGAFLPPAPPEPGWPQGGAPAALPPLSPPPNALVPLALPPLQIAPGQKRIPALPKHLPLQLPSASLLHVPAIQQHVDGLVPPPPPPPPLALPGWDKPMPPEEGEPPASAQQLAPYKPPSLSSRPLPRPPPKLPQRALLPTPPVGPPPAHAIILAKKTGFSSIDEAALVKKVKPPPMVPKLPEEAMPSFVRRNQPAEAPDIVAHRVLQGHAAPASRLGAVPEKPPKPVPDWIVKASHAATQTFVGGSILGSCFFIIYWGVYLESRAQWATHAATIVGCIMNLGVFESMKCVVIACVNLVKSETEKRQEELHARKERMALKAQRLQERAARRRRATQAAKGSAPRPPLSPQLPKQTSLGTRMQTLLQGQGTS